jgi:hypothetical protein
MPIIARYGLGVSNQAARRLQHPHVGVLGRGFGNETTCAAARAIVASERGDASLSRDGCARGSSQQRAQLEGRAPNAYNHSRPRSSARVVEIDPYEIHPSAGSRDDVAGFAHARGRPGLVDS